MRTTVHRLRYYHFGATLLAIGVAIFALLWVQEIQDDTSQNLQQTYCNQGLLTLALLDEWQETKISQCPADLQVKLRRDYR